MVKRPTTSSQSKSIPTPSPTQLRRSTRSSQPPNNPSLNNKNNNNNNKQNNNKSSTSNAKASGSGTRGGKAQMIPEVVIEVDELQQGEEEDEEDSDEESSDAEVQAYLSPAKPTQSTVGRSKNAVPVSPTEDDNDDDDDVWNETLALKQAAKQQHQLAKAQTQKKVSPKKKASTSQSKGKGKATERPIVEEESSEDEEEQDKEPTPLPPKRNPALPPPYIPGQIPVVVGRIDDGEEVDQLEEAEEEVGVNEVFSRIRAGRNVRDRIWLYPVFYGDEREELHMTLTERGAIIVDTLEEAHYAMFPRGPQSDFEHEIQMAKNANCLPIRAAWVEEAIKFHDKFSTLGKSRRSDPKDFAYTKQIVKSKERNKFTPADYRTLAQYEEKFRRGVITSKTSMYAQLEKDHGQHTVQSWENYSKKNIVKIEKLRMKVMKQAKKERKRKRAAASSSSSNDSDSEDDSDDDGEEIVPPPAKKKKSNGKKSNDVLPTKDSPLYYLVELSKIYSVDYNSILTIYKKASGDKNLIEQACEIQQLNEDERSAADKIIWDALWNEVEDEIILKYAGDEDAFEELDDRTLEDIAGRREWLASQ